MFVMDVILKVVSYLFPTLLAFTILYFFAGIAYMKYVPDYAKMDKGKKIAFNALATIFCILIVWAVVHMLFAAFV